MNEIIKPVRYGILVGLFGLAFGICWAFYLVLGHEKIHEQLEQRAVKAKEGHSFMQLLEAKEAYAHSKEKHMEDADHMEHHDAMGAASQSAIDEHQHGAQEAKQASASLHDSPIMELAHTRLRRGHIHSMGLGLVTIVISLVLAFTTAPDRIKIIVPIFAGLGGLIYPFAWIVMGYRTPGLGPDVAEASVTIIAGTGIALVLLGIFTAGLFILKDIFIKKEA